MVKFQFSKQKTKSAEKISQQVFYIMIGLAVLVFGLFLSLFNISEPTRRAPISDSALCFEKKKR